MSPKRTEEGVQRQLHGFLVKDVKANIWGPLPPPHCSFINDVRPNICGLPRSHCFLVKNVRPNICGTAPTHCSLVKDVKANILVSPPHVAHW